MPDLRLFHSPTSPYGRKVMVLLMETGQLDDVTLVAATGNPLDPGSMPLAQNPLGKIPALELEDGQAIHDSRVICRFFDHRAGGRLYPEPPTLWPVLTLEATADGVLDAAILMVYEMRIRPEELRFYKWSEGQWAKIVRALDAIETLWAAHLSGPLDMGHVAVGCALGYLDLRHGPRDWRQGRPGLAHWFAAFSERPSMAATVPPAS